jgi:SAM-dependent methyltransferase
MTTTSDFARLKQVWETLGAEDPLWAVASLPQKRGGRWDVAEFMATGEAEIARLLQLLQSDSETPRSFRHILDFGCGVGRLTLALRRRAAAVTGVDISAPMLDQARRLAGEDSGIRYHLNTRDDLSAFADGTFDLCFSHICLQHMPWAMARRYIAEFARACATGGWVMFQLPSRRLTASWAASLRQRLVDSLPFGGGQRYRRWRHGSSAVFEMHFTPENVVREFLTRLGLQVRATHPDGSAGPGTEGFVYVCRKPSAPP